VLVPFPFSRNLVVGRLRTPKSGNDPRVRGRSQPDSDYDVAVFLRDLRDRETEMNRLADIATEIVYNDGEFVHAMPYHAGSYDEQTALMQEIRAEGIDL
jgi:hypothetical protein